MKYNTIEFDGEEKSFADWGIAHGSDKLTLLNQSQDTFSFVEVGKNLLDDPTFPYFGQIKVRANRTSATGEPDTFSGGTQEFIGKRMRELADARPGYEGVQYTFAGPWFDLENTVYQQETAMWIVSQVGLQFSSELFLFTHLDSQGHFSVVSNGQQIEDILQHVIDMAAANSQPAPLQIGTIEPNQAYPSYQAKPMMCADAIQKCLEFMPDAKCYFDYTTTPPTFNCRRQSSLTPVTLGFRDQVSMESCRIEARPDLQMDSIIIYFKITENHDGRPYIVLIKDKFGLHGANSSQDPDGGLGVMIETIDLIGLSYTTISASLDCEPVAAIGGTTASKRAWWASRRGGEENQFASDPATGGSKVRFQDKFGAATTIPNATVVDENGNAINLAAFPNRVVDGSIHPWMQLPNGDPVVAVRAKVAASMTYAQYDVDGAGGNETDSNGNRMKLFDKKEHHCIITLTNGITATYSTVATFEEGEAVPTGMAQTLFEALSILQFEGNYLKVADTASGGISMANNLNLSNGRAEWATMAAMIQSLDKCLTEGTVEVSIGPSKHLNSGQLMSLFKMWRNRRQWVNPRTRETGLASSGGGTFEIVKNSPKGNTTQGTEVLSGHMVTASASGGNTTQVHADAPNQQWIIQVVNNAGAPQLTAGQIMAKLSDLLGTNKVAKFRETVLCESDGAGGTVEKKSWVFRTESENV